MSEKPDGFGVVVPAVRFQFHVPEALSEALTS